MGTGTDSSNGRLTDSLWRRVQTSGDNRGTGSRNHGSR